MLLTLNGKGRDNNVSQLKDLLAFQNADLKLQRTEKVVKGTENRQKFMRLHKKLKDMQESISKQTAELEKLEAAMQRLQTQAEAAAREIALESSELSILLDDSLTTAEEMKEFIRDVERLDEEWVALVREAQAAAAAAKKLGQDYGATRKAATALKKEYDEVRALCDAEKEQGATAIAEAQARLDLARKAVNAALMAKYDKARKYFCAPVVAVVADKCGGCNMSLPGNFLRSLTTGEIAECENCGRLLYIENG